MAKHKVRIDIGYEQYLSCDACDLYELQRYKEIDDLVAFRDHHELLNDPDLIKKIANGEN